jgi:hypothetical protein
MGSKHNGQCIKSKFNGDTNGYKYGSLDSDRLGEDQHRLADAPIRDTDKYNLVLHYNKHMDL